MACQEEENINTKKILLIETHEQRFKLSITSSGGKNLSNEVKLYPNTPPLIWNCVSSVLSMMASFVQCLPLSQDRYPAVVLESKISSLCHLPPPFPTPSLLLSFLLLFFRSFFLSFSNHLCPPFLHPCFIPFLRPFFLLSFCFV